MKKETKNSSEALNTKTLWNATQAAEYFQIPLSTFHLFVSQNKIPKIKIGKHTRFIPEQLFAWAKKQAG